MALTLQDIEQLFLNADIAPTTASPSATCATRCRPPRWPSATTPAPN